MSGTKKTTYTYSASLYHIKDEFRTGVQGTAVANSPLEAEQKIESVARELGYDLLEVTSLRRK